MPIEFEPHAKSPEDGLRAEIAGLFVAGYRRLRADRRQSTAHPPDSAPVTPPLSNSQEGLDNAHEESVHVPA